MVTKKQIYKQEIKEVIVDNPASVNIANIEHILNTLEKKPQLPEFKKKISGIYDPRLEPIIKSVELEDSVLETMQYYAKKKLKAYFGIGYMKKLNKYYNSLKEYGDNLEI